MCEIDEVTSLRMEATSSEPIGTEGCVMLGIRCPSCCNFSDSTASFPSNSATCSFSCLPTTNPLIHSNTHHSITKPNFLGFVNATKKKALKPNFLCFINATKRKH